jgi:hypothetical protein
VVRQASPRPARAGSSGDDGVSDAHTHECLGHSGTRVRTCGHARRISACNLACHDGGCVANSRYITVTVASPDRSER